MGVKQSEACSEHYHTTQTISEVYTMYAVHGMQIFCMKYLAYYIC